MTAAFHNDATPLPWRSPALFGLLSTGLFFLVAGFAGERPVFGDAGAPASNALDGAQDPLKKKNLGETEPAERHRKMARALGRAGKMPQAEAAWRNALRLDVSDAASHVELGLVLGAQGKAEAAIDEFHAAIRLDPATSKPHLGLGMVYRRLNRFPEAETAYREAIRLSPEDAKAHSGLGFALASQGKLEEALAATKEAVRLSPSSPDNYVYLGSLLLRHDESLDEAQAAFEHALRLKADYAPAINGLAGIMFKRRDFAAAEEAFRTSVVANSKDVLAQKGLAKALRAQSKYDEAVVAFRRAILCAPRDVENYIDLGYSLFHTKPQGVDEAAIVFEQAIQLEPGNLLAHLGLGMALGGQRRYSEAEAALRRAKEIDSHHPSVCFFLAQMLAARERHEEALAEYREVIGSKTKEPFADEKFGISLAAIGEFDEALEAFQRAADTAKVGSAAAQRANDKISDTNRRKLLAPRLPAVLQGDDTPSDEEEAILFAEMAFDARRYAAATRLWTTILSTFDDAPIGEAPPVHRAAYAAVFCASGQGRDAPEEQEARTAHRNQALLWLTTKLRRGKERFDADATSRGELASFLREVSYSPKLSSVRDELDKLPPVEADKWRAFWNQCEEIEVEVASSEK